MSKLSGEARARRQREALLRLHAARMVGQEAVVTEVLAGNQFTRNVVNGAFLQAGVDGFDLNEEEQAVLDAVNAYMDSFSPTEARVMRKRVQLGTLTVREILRQAVHRMKIEREVLKVLSGEVAP